jgi:hypothetical protein
MAVDGPRTTAGTDRPDSSELIFAELNRGESPKSSRGIKPLSSGLPASNPTPLLPTVQPHARTLNRSATRGVEFEQVAEAEADQREILDLLKSKKA